MNRFCLWVAVLSGLWTGVPLSAHAQDSDDARARTHFEAGRLHFEEGAYDRARDEFARAWELSRRPPLLINLATVEERLAMYESAAGRLNAYLRLVPNAPNAPQLRRRIENLNRLRAQRQASQSSAAPAPAPATTSAQATTSTAASGGGGGDGLVLGGIIGLAVGGAGFIAQGIFGGLALAEDSALRDGCGATASCTEQEVADANTFALVSDIMMGVGIAGAAAGATLLILGLLSDGSSDTAALTPYLAPDGAGLLVEERF